MDAPGYHEAIVNRVAVALLDAITEDATLQALVDAMTEDTREGFAGAAADLAQTYATTAVLFMVTSFATIFALMSRGADDRQKAEHMSETLYRLVDLSHMSAEGLESYYDDAVEVITGKRP